MLFLSLALVPTSVIPFGEQALNIVANLMPDNLVILEAGSYDGADTLKMAQCWPHANIYTFEPIHELLQKAKKTVGNLTNVHFYDLALHSTTGKVKFYIASDAFQETMPSSSILEPKEHLKYYTNVQFNSCRELEAINLDEWAQKNGVDHIDFMWLDIQGSELSVLKAAPILLKTVKMIFTEVALAETYKGVPLYCEMRAWLEAQGFSVIHEEQTSICEANVLFLRNEFNKNGNPIKVK